MIELGIVAVVLVFLFLLWSLRWFRRSIRWAITAAILTVALICCVGGSMLSSGAALGPT